MKILIKSYKIVSITTSALFAFLFFQLFLNSGSFFKSLGIQPCEDMSILARRTSIFMLGLSILLFFSRSLPSSNARQYICISTGIVLLGLACMGSYELIKGTVNTSMWQAIIIETTSGTSFLIIFFKNISKKHFKTK